MKQIQLLACFTLLGFGIKAQQKIADYIFPKGIFSAHYVSINSKGEDIEGMTSRIMYIHNENQLKFQQTQLLDGRAVSYIKRTFIINDSTIYLTNETNGRNSYNYSSKNIFVRLPSSNTTAKWTTNEGTTNYKCEAKRGKQLYDGELKESIVIERTPVENNVSLPDFKTKMVYIYGVGLFEEKMSKTGKTLYRLDSIVNIR